MLLGFFCMAVLLSAPQLIISAYTDDVDINLMAVSLIKLGGLFIALDSVQVTTSFCLRAFKDTRAPFVIMCIAYWLITLPLGYWLGIVVADNPLDGTRGFWLSMIAGIAISSVLMLRRLMGILRRPLVAV
jgi:MATE family multidrug resistance protein